MLAQVAAEDVEMTAGSVLAALLVVTMFTGSLVMLRRWWRCYERSEPIIPAATRSGVRVPLGLVAFGLLTALMMASAAVVSSISQGASKTPASANESDQPNDEKTVTADETGTTAIDQETFAAALWHTVQMDLILIFVLGAPLWLLSRTGGGTPAPEGSGNRQIHEDAPSENLYEAPRESFAPVAKLTPSRVEDPWQLGTELRIATQACVAAWFPTTGLRVLVMILASNQSQHPFLEMMQNGVPITILGLIALTAVVLAPVMEELLYRVIILGGMINRPDTSGTSIIFAISVSSILFAFAHGFPDSIALLPLAAVIGWTYHQRRSYRTVVLIHFLFNGFNILLAGLSML